MTEEEMVSAVEEKLNSPEDFDVFAYIDEQPLAEDEVVIATNGKAVGEMVKLLNLRDAELEVRAEMAKQMKDVEYLSIADEDQDTEYDERINELTKIIEETSLTFEMQSVAPTLVKAINKNYTAKEKSAETEEEKERLKERREADILRRAIKAVRTGDGGKRSTKEWTVEEILDLDNRFHPEQGAKLITALYNIVYMGQAFDQALTPDFS